MIFNKYCVGYGVRGVRHEVCGVRESTLKNPHMGLADCFVPLHGTRNDRGINSVLCIHKTKINYL
jgi:hypothetical protein